MYVYKPSKELSNLPPSQSTLLSSLLFSVMFLFSLISFYAYTNVPAENSDCNITHCSFSLSHILLTPFHAILLQPILYSRPLSPLFSLSLSLSLLFLQILFYIPIHVNFLKHFSYFSFCFFIVFYSISINTRNVSIWHLY